jgi:hypothetical protein
MQVAKEDVRSAILRIVDKFPMNKTDIAKALGVKPTAISYWISGKRNITGNHYRALLGLLNGPDGSDPTIYKNAESLRSAIDSFSFLQADKFGPSLVNLEGAIASFLARLSPSDKKRFPLKISNELLATQSIGELGRLIGQVSGVLQRKIEIQAMTPAEFVNWFIAENKIEEDPGFKVRLIDCNQYKDEVVKNGKNKKAQLPRPIIYDFLCQIEISASEDAVSSISSMEHEVIYESFVERYGCASQKSSSDDEVLIDKAFIEAERAIGEADWSRNKERFASLVFRDTAFRKSVTHKDRAVYEMDCSHPSFKESLSIVYERSKNLRKNWDQIESL